MLSRMLLRMAISSTTPHCIKIFRLYEAFRKGAACTIADAALRALTAGFATVVVGFLLARPGMAVPIATTSVHGSIAVQLSGGGRAFEQDTGAGPKLPAGNGIRLTGDPTAEAFAASSVVVNGSEGVKEDGKIDPDTGEKDDEKRFDLVGDYIPAYEKLEKVVQTRKETLRVAEANAGGLRKKSGVHVAEVLTNELKVTRSQLTNDDGTPKNASEPNQVGLVQMAQTTSAGAQKEEPDSARATALGLGVIKGFSIQNRFDPRFAVPDAFKPSVELVWNLSTFTLSSTCCNSAALIIINATVEETGPAGKTSKQVGLNVFVENGKEVQVKSKEVNDQDKTIENAVKNGLKNRKVLDLSVKIPLSDGFRTAGGAKSDLSVFVNMIGQTRENVLIANKVEGEKAGHKPEEAPLAPRQAPSALPSANLHWDADSRTLSFDSVPINVLTSGAQVGIDPRYLSDPLVGAMLVIDPVTHIGDFGDVELFEGGIVRITDGQKDLFSARMPTLAFDESLFDLQGFGLFGALLDIVIDETLGSLWLADYTNSLLSGLQQLSIGLGSPLMDIVGSSSFADAPSFNHSAEFAISFSIATIPTPSSLPLFVLGLLGLCVVASARLARHRHLTN